MLTLRGSVSSARLDTQEGFLCVCVCVGGGGDPKSDLHSARLAAGGRRTGLIRDVTSALVTPCIICITSFTIAALKKKRKKWIKLCLRNISVAARAMHVAPLQCDVIYFVQFTNIIV